MEISNSNLILISIFYFSEIIIKMGLIVLKIFYQIHADEKMPKASASIFGFSSYLSTCHNSRTRTETKIITFSIYVYFQNKYDKSV